MIKKMNNWKDFKIKDVFKTQKRNSILYVPTWAYIPQKELKKGLIPRITVTAENNWIENFSTSTHKNYRKFKNFLSVSFLWSVFYHNYETSLDMKVHCLKPKEKILNKNLWLFLSSTIKKSLDNASYWNQISSSDLPQKTILLPINENNQINWEYMEQYTKNIIQNKIKKYISYVEKQLSTLEYKEIPTLEEKEWREFWLNEIFSNIKRGKRHIEKNRKKWNIPYYSASKNNNWLTDFISNPKFVIYEKSIIYSTFWDAYFTNEKFTASDEIAILTNPNLNLFNWLFLCTSLNKNKIKYSFWRKAFINKIHRDKILVPVNQNKQPDWEYMEQYIKNIFIKKYTKALNYFKK